MLCCQARFRGYPCCYLLLLRSPSYRLIQRTNKLPNQIKECYEILACSFSRLPVFSSSRPLGRGNPFHYPIRLCPSCFESRSYRRSLRLVARRFIADRRGRGVSREARIPKNRDKSPHQVAMMSRQTHYSLNMKIKKTDQRSINPDLSERIPPQPR